MIIFSLVGRFREEMKWNFPLCLLYLLSLCFLLTVYGAEDSECPVCMRVLRASKELAKDQGIPISAALDKVCRVTKDHDVEEQQFCYNIDTIRADLNRVLDLGAGEARACKKVKSINPHFCSLKDSSKNKNKPAAHVNEKQVKGVIYM